MKIINGLPVFEYGNRKNRPILFVHGFTFNSGMWNKQIEYFKNDFHCVAYDVRGLGESRIDRGQYTMESFSDDLLDIVDQLALDKPVLCGLSMGGYISLRTIEREETKFSALVLFDTRADDDTKEAKLKRAAGIKLIDQQGLDKFLEGFLPNCFSEEFRANSIEEYQSIFNQSLKCSPIGVKGCLLAMLGRTNTTPYLSNIKIPTTVFCGEKDVLSPVDEMRLMTEKISDAKFIVVPGAGHLSPVEKPEFVNEKLSKFLKSLY